MRNIVVEGIDASGKSTLVKVLAEKLGMHVQEGEGPPKYKGEIDERIRRLLARTDHVFDRHPCVSQAIYCSIRKGQEHPRKDLTKQFYDTNPFFIYCRATSLDGHVVKDYEDPEHVMAVNENHTQLLKLYDAWAVRYAHCIYRIGDNVSRLISAAAHR